MSVGSFTRALLKRTMRHYVNETPHDYRDSYGGLGSHHHLVWTASPEGEVIPVDTAWEDFTGAPQSEWADLVHPDELEEVKTLWQLSLDTGKDFDHLHRLRHKDGTYYWMHARGFPFRDGKGRIIYWYGTTELAHERVMAQMERDTLYSEVDHRSKNLLQVVRGLVRLADRSGSIDHFVDTLDDRLTSLSSAYTLLADSHWQSADVYELLERELAAFKHQVAIRGPNTVKLLHKHTQPFAMTIHELATNAVKYGALSTPKGKLDVALACTGSTLHVRWTELGGPPATAPNHSGFGTRLIDRQSAYLKVARQWLDEGLIVDIECTDAVCRTAA
jgi:PAS domain S-box-containing protein